MPDHKKRRDNEVTKSKRYLNAPNHTMIHFGGPNQTVDLVAEGITSFPSGVTGYLLTSGYWYPYSPE